MPDATCREQPPCRIDVNQGVVLCKLHAYARDMQQALPDPDKLETLALWLDLKEAADPSAGVEVQLDLRRWARKARDLLAKSDAMGVTK